MFSTPAAYLVAVLMLGLASLIVNHWHTDKSAGNGQPSVMVKYLQESSISLKRSKRFDHGKSGTATDDFIFKPGDSLVAELNCDKHGGPSDAIAKEMVYWEHIPSDSQYVSPLKTPGVAKYITFEPGNAGWDNARLAMETAIAMSLAMGRTLVLPPKQAFQSMSESEGKDGKYQQNTFLFTDIFPLKQVNWEHSGLHIITMQEFLQGEAMVGNLRDHNGNVLFPPFNLTDWDGEFFVFPLIQWLRNVTHVSNWDPAKCVATFPSSADPNDLQTLRKLKSIVETSDALSLGEAKLQLADAPTAVRMRKMLAGRRELCLYDETIQNARFLHFPNEKNIPGSLLQAHFEKFLFFQDWRQEVWMKRFVRDHIRYKNDIQCAAARIVQKLKERAKGGISGTFDCFHFRRENVHNVSHVDADWIYEVMKADVLKNSTVFIATDEANHTFLAPLKKHYDVVFLNDFRYELYRVNTNFYGLIDQLVASKSRYYFGPYESVCSAYTNRLRGYHAVRAKASGNRNGSTSILYDDRRDQRSLFNQNNI